MPAAVIGPPSPKFPDRLVTSPIFGRDDYVMVEQPFRFVSDVVGTVTAEAGFDSDGASIPSAIRPLINPGSNLRWAALPHDVLYWHQAVSAEPDARKVTRKEADMVIMEAMEACGVSWVTRRLVYDQLRLWGWAAWNANAEKRKKENFTGIYQPVAGNQAMTPILRQRHFHK